MPAQLRGSRGQFLADESHSEERKAAVSAGARHGEPRSQRPAANPASAAFGAELCILFEEEKWKGGPFWQRKLVFEKKEEFPGIMETCCLGTPFPRSALFL
jgi:hypothetical protein